MKSRRDKLVALGKWCNLETGEIYKEEFREEEVLLEKARAMKMVAKQVKRCCKCPGMNVIRITEGCPGWGCLNAEVFFVGQSLHEPGMVSQIPFIGGSGLAIIAALRLSGLERRDCFWSNVVHCHPERNRASTDEEKENCLSYLEQEIEIVQPRIIIGLGNDAKWGIEKLGKAEEVFTYKHPAAFSYAAPEKRVSWIIKLSMEIDKIIGDKNE